MDTTCDFFQAYAPSETSPEPVLLYHLSNCASCREEAYVLDDLLVETPE